MYKQQAKIGNYLIARKDDDSIVVINTANNTSYDNTKEALNTAAKQVGFVYDESWNTRMLGRKLIEYINANAPVAEEKTQAQQPIPEKRTRTPLELLQLCSG